jgi:hypothetical protein
VLQPQIKTLEANLIRVTNAADQISLSVTNVILLNLIEADRLWLEG